jgi:hypothetical protein
MKDVLWNPSELFSRCNSLQSEEGRERERERERERREREY